MALHDHRRHDQGSEWNVNDAWTSSSAKPPIVAVMCRKNATNVVMQIPINFFGVVGTKIGELQVGRFEAVAASNGVKGIPISNFIRFGSRRNVALRDNLERFSLQRHCSPPHVGG